jgi:hypothetical protein
MAPTPHPHEPARTVATVLLLAGLLLLVVGIVYLTIPAYGLPWFLPHQPSAISHSVRRGSLAVILAVLCVLGAWLVSRRAGRPGRR